MENRALVKHPTLVVMLTGSDASAAQFAKQLPLDVAARLTTTARGALRGANSDLTVWRTVGIEDTAKANFSADLNKLRSENRIAQRSVTDTSPAQFNRKLIFRAVVICDVLDQNLAVSKELDNVAVALRAAAGDTVELQLAVMLLYKTRPGTAPSTYAIRIQATNLAAGGAIVEPEGVREAARHVVVALLTASAAWDKLMQLSGTNHWVTVGAAAVNMRQTDMHAYSYGKAINRTTKLLVKEPTQVDHEHAKIFVDQQQNRASWSTAAWQVLADEGYQQSAAGPAPAAALPDPLAIAHNTNWQAHYSRLDTNGRLAARSAAQTYLDNLASRARKELARSTPESESAPDGTEESKSINLPNGLARLRSILKATKESLGLAVLLHDAETQDAPMRYCFTSPALHKALAAETTASAAARQVRQRRIERSVLHPLGQAICLLPAALAAERIMRPDQVSLLSGKSLAIALAACAVIGIAEYLYWKRTIAVKAKSLAGETALGARRQALALLNTAFGRAHETTARATDDAINGTEQILRLLKREIQSASKAMRLAEAQIPNTFRTIFLANLNICDERAGLAVEALGKDRATSLSVLLADTMFPNPAGSENLAPAIEPWRYPAAVRNLFNRIRTITEAQMRTTSLELSALISQNHATHNGTMWGWLVERALPLGLAQEHTKSKLWFCTAVDSLFATADGGTARLKQLGYDADDYEHLTSELDCELVCIRAFVDTPFDQNELDTIKIALGASPRKTPR